MIKGFWKFNVSMQADIHTWRTVLIHTHTVCRMICLVTFPLLWFLFQVLNQRGCGLVREGGGGIGAPFLEELLSGSRGQHKGRILVLESGRGEEGWNHVSFIPPLSSPDWESINSFNPVFLWIRLAFWATAALFSNHSPRGAGRGLGSTESEAKGGKW